MLMNPGFALSWMGTGEGFAKDSLRKAFHRSNDPELPQTGVDECIGLKSTVEPRVTYPESRLFGRAARSLF
jgi:hypothetical protein